MLDSDPCLVDLGDYSAVMIGGSGAYSAVCDYEWTPSLLAFTNRCIDSAKPLFGSCWGHQVIARAAGGSVIHDSSKSEMGGITVYVTPAADADPVFSRMPTQFHANAGHHDRVAVLPPGAIELAWNDSQRHQAFRLAGLPIYGTQFHGELDAQAEKERLIEYREHYRADMPSDDEFQRVIDSLQDTSAADNLLRYFLEAFVESSS